MVFKKLFLLILFFVIVTPTQAVSWPPEVKPEKGKASGTVGSWDDLITVNIEFWNVGEIGGDEYGKATVDFGCKQKMVNEWTCTADEQPPGIGTFSDGPNGKITINEMKIVEGGDTIQLADGTKFKSDKAIIKAAVENPEIFSKYNWDISAIDKGESDEPVEEVAENASVEDSGARFSSISGSVKIIPSGGTEDDWEFAKPNQVLLEGTRIITGDGKRDMVIITFDDKSTLLVPSDSEIVIPKLNKPKSSLEVISGKIKANIIKPLLSGEGLNIRTNQSVTGIKGTIFVVETTPNATLIKVLDGKVAFTSIKSGETAELLTGESITADNNGLTGKTAFDVASENAFWDALVKESDRSVPRLSNIAYAVLAVIAAVIIGTVLKFRMKKAGNR